MSLKDFFRKKDVIISSERYLIVAMSNMAMGLFSSLLVGTILKTVGSKLNIPYLVEVVSPIAMKMTGPAIGVSIAYGLKAPGLVLFASTITGAFGNEVGGPVGAFFGTVVGVELGKLISKETKVDIILTPIFTILTGMLAAEMVGPSIAKLMSSFGKIIMVTTELQPFFMGICISVLMGIALTLPISSAAISMMLGLNGIAAGAATVGCCCQMVGFAIISFKENGFGGLAAQGLGTSMLQMGNIIKNWKIWIPSILSSAILGPVSTIIFKMENSPIGAGMGTSGLVGQIATIGAMEEIGRGGNKLYLTILLLHIVLPAILTLFFSTLMRKKGYIKDGDLKLDL